MDEKFYLEYDLYEHGWATARLRHGETAVEMVASYFHDSLREMADAAFAVSRGSAERRVVFMDEPGEHQLTFFRESETECRYSVDWFDDWESWGIRTRPETRRICEGIVSARRLVQQVYSLLWTLHETYGGTGYKSRWCEHEFPLQEMERLVKTSVK